MVGWEEEKVNRKIHGNYGMGADDGNALESHRITGSTQRRDRFFKVGVCQRFALSPVSLFE